MRMEYRKLIFVLILAFSCFRHTAQIISYSVDAFPINVGGKTEFKRVFEQELIYPEHLLKDKTERKVTINFTLLKDSSVTNIQVVGSGAAEADVEALRIFRLYQWVPAIKEGKYVSTKWSATFEFEP